MAFLSKRFARAGTLGLAALAASLAAAPAASPRRR